LSPKTNSTGTPALLGKRQNENPLSLSKKFESGIHLNSQGSQGMDLGGNSIRNPGHTNITDEGSEASEIQRLLNEDKASDMLAPYSKERGGSGAGNGPGSVIIRLQTGSSASVADQANQNNTYA